MTLTNLRKKDTIRTSINYRVPLWDRCVPGKQEPAFAGLADTCTCRRCKCLQDPSHKPKKTLGNVARIQDLCSHRAGC